MVPSSNFKQFLTPIKLITLLIFIFNLLLTFVFKHFKTRVKNWLRNAYVNNIVRNLWGILNQALMITVPFRSIRQSRVSRTPSRTPNSHARHADFGRVPKTYSKVQKKKLYRTFFLQVTV
jgi:hypothetical protein